MVRKPGRENKASSNGVAMVCDPQAEQVVLATLLQHPEVLPELSRALDWTHFFEDAHQRVYRAALALWSAGKPIDLASVGRALCENGQIDDVGGCGYLGELCEGLAVPSSVLYHAEKIRELATRRTLILRLQGLTDRAEHSNEPPAELIAETAQQLEQLGAEAASRPTHTWKLIPLADAGDAQSKPELLGLLYPDKRHLIYGEPESLKTWLALCATAEVICSGGKVLYIDHETEQAKHLGRLSMAAAGGVRSAPREGRGKKRDRVESPPAPQVFAVLASVPFLKAQPACTTVQSHRRCRCLRGS
jgi:hypothetical protein